MRSVRPGVVRRNAGAMDGIAPPACHVFTLLGGDDACAPLPASMWKSETLMLQKLFILAVGAVLGAAGVVGYAATKPNEFRIVRSTLIEASPDKIAAAIQDFRTWRQWSPFERLDPKLKRQFSGPAAGQGAVYAWEGNGEAGAGRMEILAATPRRVSIELDFIRPFETSNMAEFTLEPEGEATRVTWAMVGPSPLMVKVMDLFYDIDRAVGAEFETGLANLKALSER